MTEENTILEYDEDISGAEAPEPIPVGEYIGTIIDANIRVSKNTGNHYCEVQFRIDREQYPADFDAENDPDGVTLFYRRLTIGSTSRDKYRMRKWCETIGFPPSNRIDIKEWVGHDARLEISHQDDQEGNPRAEIARVLSAD